VLGMMPYIATIVVMIFSVSETVRKRFGAPAALGIPFVREER